MKLLLGLPFQAKGHITLTQTATVQNVTAESMCILLTITVKPQFYEV